MATNHNNDTPQGQGMADALKSWVMIVLTLIFVLLYAAALTGWLKAADNEKVVTRLEPIIFVIIGYYFGRLPAQQNEKTLKDEIGRQTQKADAAQHSKEQAQQARESLEEKVKNTRAVLTTAPIISAKGAAPESAGAASTPKDDAMRGSVAAAINILNS